MKYWSGVAIGLLACFTLVLGFAAIGWLSAGTIPAEAALFIAVASFFASYGLARLGNVMMSEACFDCHNDLDGEGVRYNDKIYVYALDYAGKTIVQEKPNPLYTTLCRDCLNVRNG